MKVVRMLLESGEMVVVEGVKSVTVEERLGIAIAEEIRSFLAANGVTQKDLARKAGMTQPGISRMISNPPRKFQQSTWNKIRRAMERCKNDA